jgi:hypothetical protein
MDSITFEAVVGEDQVIRPPSGVVLPPGAIEVTIKPLPQNGDDPLATTRAWLVGLARECERIAPGLPSDLAANHDYYAHGKPRP